MNDKSEQFLRMKLSQHIEDQEYFITVIEKDPGEGEDKAFLDGMKPH